MASIIHFNISADDMLRAKNFYEKLFGWKIKKIADIPSEYYLIEALEKTENKGIIGGLAKRDKTNKHITNYIEVSNIDTAIKKIQELGGNIIGAKSLISNIGYRVECEDTEGNIFGIIEQRKA